MVPASPISGIMCDHYPVPPITTRPQVRVSKKKKKEKRGVLLERTCVWVSHQERGKMKNENCVRTCGASVRALRTPSRPPRCHSIHPVISNYGETQVFATASLGLPDLICSTPSVNQPLTRRSMVRHGPRFSSRICRRGLWGIITCIWGREDDDSKWIFY